MPARIRSATAEDATGVAVVHVETWREAYRGLIDQSVLDAQRVERRAEMWTRWIDRSLAGRPSYGDGGVAHSMLVAELAGDIVGWATFGEGRDRGDTDRGELAGLYVLPSCWGLGLGHSLIERAELALRDEGWREAYLWVLHGNERAARFYERHGWHADGAEKIGAAGGATGLRELRHVRRLE
ncbi:GNAT family N-acetyltransferase [Agrococcus sp. DT81.2]|uniref:GNAT family N-acetyltransferase n=1 Tax=Agrococcus sp. DT81.2 TaxID=3393414 RepID=UPI003CE49E3D